MKLLHNDNLKSPLCTNKTLCVKAGFCQITDNVCVPNGLEMPLNYFPILVTVRQYIRKFVEMYRVAVWLSLACLKAGLKAWIFLLHCLLCCILYTVCLCGHWEKYYL